MSKKKPYSLESRELGRGSVYIKKFATLNELTDAIKEQWQGSDYIDGDDSFHTDYCSFVINGAKLTDIGNFNFHDGYREFTFNEIN